MGKKHVWTEREQVDEELICESCGAVNGPDDLECHECNQSLLSTNETNSWLSEQTTSVTPRSDVANTSFNASTIETLYREFSVVKAGMTVIGKSVAVVISLLCSIYLLYQVLLYFDTTSTAVMGVGVLGCLLLSAWAWGDDNAELGMFE